MAEQDHAAHEGEHEEALDATIGPDLGDVVLLRPAEDVRRAAKDSTSAGAVSADDEQFVYRFEGDSKRRDGLLLKTADGATNWSATAAVEIAGVFGTGAPAIAQSTVVAGFSSGELNAYRAEKIGRASCRERV